MSKYDRAGDNLISVFNEYIFEHLEDIDFLAYIADNQTWKNTNIATHNSIKEQLNITIGQTRDRISRSGNIYPGLIDWATTKPYLDTLDIAPEQVAPLGGGGEKAIVTNIQIPYIQ
tara:strand:- start:111 stop:458 length:348 start_codon:yes stop_codon:yes gene_type:complete